MPPIDATHLAEFMAFFEGNGRNFGEHIYKDAKEGEKEQGTSTSITNVLLTEQQYTAHLEGNKGLGVVPINEHNECSFGVIDIDAYKGMPDYPGIIDRQNIPLVPFRSKSGGLHVYLFMKHPIAASLMVSFLSEFAVLLGIDLFLRDKLNKGVEFFPKQTKLTEKSTGSWINLPYYNAAKTKQYAIVGGKPLSLAAALRHIQGKRKTTVDIRAFMQEVQFHDGPPCLRTICMLADTEANRNNFLFSVAVYWKKKDENFWEQKVFEANDMLTTPLDREEVESTIIASLRKKEYVYKCNDAPCVTYCRKQACKKAHYGVGKEDGYFSEIEFGKMAQIRTVPPYYEWEIRMQGAENFIPLRFRTEDELIRQDTFLRLCLRELHLLPGKMKQSEWTKIINQSFASLEVKQVDKEDDTSGMAIFRTYFLEFLLQRAPARTRDQIVHRRVYHDKSRHIYMFRVQDLTEFFFVQKNFHWATPVEIHGILRDIGAKPDRIRTESDRQLRLYVINERDVLILGSLEVTTFEAQFEEKQEEF